jgi:hypothetical protein
MVIGGRGRPTPAPNTATDDESPRTRGWSAAGGGDADGAGLLSAFSDDATALIHQTSRGYPRAVNNLAIQSLVAAFAADKSIVDESSRRRRRGHGRLNTKPAT